MPRGDAKGSGAKAGWMRLRVAAVLEQALKLGRLGFTEIWWDWEIISVKCTTEPPTLIKHATLRGTIFICYFLSISCLLTHQRQITHSQPLGMWPKLPWCPFLHKDWGAGRVRWQPAFCFSSSDTQRNRPWLVRDCGRHGMSSVLPCGWDEVLKKLWDLTGYSPAIS